MYEVPVQFYGNGGVEFKASAMALCGLQEGSIVHQSV